MFKKSWLAATVIALGLALSSESVLARQSPLIEPERVLLARANGDELSMDQMRAAILAGARQHMWVATQDKPGQITLRFDKGSRHTAVVTVDYDTKGYLVRYASSVNLEHAVVDGQTLIHPNYNRWIRNLIHSIGRAAAY